MSAPRQTTQALATDVPFKLPGGEAWTSDTGRMYYTEPNGTHQQWPISVAEWHEFTFTEVDGDGATATYVATLTVPAGYSVLDIKVGSTVLWNATTTATLTVGDGDSSTGYINAKNLKSGGDIPADTSGAWTYAASGAGGTYALGKYYAAEGTVTMTVDVNDNGTHHAGRTRIGVLLARGARTVTAATHTA